MINFELLYIPCKQYQKLLGLIHLLERSFQWMLQLLPGQIVGSLCSSVSNSGLYMATKKNQYYSYHLLGIRIQLHYF